MYLKGLANEESKGVTEKKRKMRNCAKKMRKKSEKNILVVVFYCFFFSVFYLFFCGFYKWKYFFSLLLYCSSSFNIIFFSFKGKSFDKYLLNKKKRKKTKQSWILLLTFCTLLFTVPTEFSWLKKGTKKSVYNKLLKLNPVYVNIYMCNNRLFSFKECFSNHESCSFVVVFLFERV